MEGIDFVQTSPCGRGQHHPRGVVGKIWKIITPDSVNVGDCFLKGRLKAGDLFLCTQHSGDFFQEYIFINTQQFLDGHKYLVGLPQHTFCSYGVGDAEEFPITLSADDIETLRRGHDGLRISTVSYWDRHKNPTNKNNE